MLLSITRIELCSQANITTSKSISERTQERVPSFYLHQSNLAMPHSSGKLKIGISKKSRFSSLRKMFDPFSKNKSQRSLLSRSDEIDSEMTSDLADSVDQQNMICSSYQNDLQEPCFLEHNYGSKEKEGSNLVPQCSPAHLHGLVKSGKKHGMPFFEFSVKSPEGVYVAKAQKAENDFTWIYTFHSLHHRRMGSGSGWRLKDSNRGLSLVGQLHISCQVCSEFKGAGEFKNFMATEFVLYDIIRSRKRTSSRDNSVQPLNSIRAPWYSDEFSSQAKGKMKESIQSETVGQLGFFRGSGRLDPSILQPFTAAELHPELEIAAIVIEAPFENTESLKIMSRDNKIGVTLPHSKELGKVDDICDTSNSAKMHVLIPSGSHSVPITESCGCPSPLLDRWRSGGGCDCGGWDMACPLTVFTNPRSEIADAQATLNYQNIAELFVQGRKDYVPAFTMKKVGDGNYAVDFHAQLSSLQAFSISVAILHSAENSVVGQMGSKQSNLFAWDATKNGIADEEERSKAEVLSSFAVNRVFSPVARA